MSGLWHIAYLATELNEDGSPAGSRINTVNEIDIEPVQRDIAAVESYCRSEQFIQALTTSIHQLNSAVAEFCQPLVGEPLDETRLDEHCLTYARLLLNTVSLFDDFIGHANHSLGALAGKRSKKMREWKSKLQDEQSSQFELRLFRELRKYCRRAGLPPLVAELVEQGDSVHYQITMAPAALLQERCWSEVLTAELEERAENIVLADMLFVWIKSVKNLAAELLRQKQTKAVPAAQRIDQMRAELPLPENAGALCVVQFPDVASADGGALSLNLHWLPEKQAKLLSAC